MALNETQRADRRRRNQEVSNLRRCAAAVAPEKRAKMLRKQEVLSGHDADTGRRSIRLLIMLGLLSRDDGWTDLVRCKLFTH